MSPVIGGARYFHLSNGKAHGAEKIKQMLREWDRKYPGRVDNMFRSLANVVPSHLMDKDLFGFKDIKADGVASPLGDIAFDEEPCSTPVMGTIALQAV